jgi:hypothetical protein
MSVQVNPLPVKPALQTQVRDPGVFEQVAFGLHPPLLVRHSSTSVQVTPLPLKPARHVQVRLPTVLVHVALASQPPFAVRHSLGSQTVPSRSVPAWQVKVHAPFTH